MFEERVDAEEALIHCSTLLQRTAPISPYGAMSVPSAIEAYKKALLLLLARLPQPVDFSASEFLAQLNLQRSTGSHVAGGGTAHVCSAPSHRSILIIPFSTLAILGGGWKRYVISMS